MRDKPAPELRQSDDAPCDQPPVTRETIDAWFEAYGERLLAAVALMTRDHGLAEDIVQDTFLMCLRTIGGNNAFRSESNPYTWLYRMAFYRLLEAQKRRGSKVPSFSSLGSDAASFYETDPFVDEKAPTGLDAVLRQEQSDIVRSALGQITPRFESTLRLCDMHDMTYEEVADQLNIPLGTVRSRLSRGRGELCQLLVSSQQERDVHLHNRKPPRTTKAGVPKEKR